jgi:hypothetical protein
LRIALAIIVLGIALTAVSRDALAQIEVMPSDSAFAPIIRLQGTFYQVRVDQRVIVRLPSQSFAPMSAPVGKAKKPATVKYKEQKIGKCLWIDKLAGSRPGTKDTLELLTRDGVLIRAYLGDGCLAREFYAGAYMERPFDGKLCIDRDLLHARTGAKCEVDKFRLLVPR